MEEQQKSAINSLCFMRYRTKSVFLLTLLSLLLLSACQNKTKHRPDTAPEGPYQLRDSSKLVILTTYGSTTFFNYRGQDMGFQYELGSQFAKYLNLPLEVKLSQNPDEMVRMLQRGEADIIAYNLPVTRELKDELLYCGEEAITHQVIIQRQSANRKKVLTDVTQLIGKDVYVKPGKYHQRLLNLNNELGGGIQIHLVESDSISQEDLISQVAKGQIDYTVADNDLAKVNKTYYPRLNIALQISFDQRAAWAVHKDCPKLAETINLWSRQHKSSQTYTASMKRYFEQSKAIPHSPILSIREGKISHYDPLFKKYAQEIDWDWRLLASLAYTESNFDTTAVSWAGAKGLMQLMPRTAHAMGVPVGKESNPEESIKGAVKYIGLTEKSFQKITDSEERHKFILAAYNSGIGHVLDAMALAEKYGKDPHIWTGNVEKFILLKSNEQYFTDPVCRYGYFHGTETYDFVRETYARFKIYKQKIKS